MFADAAGWNRAIRFAGGAGGHMPALQVAEQARGHPVADLSQERIKRRPVLGGLVNEYQRAV